MYWRPTNGLGEVSPRDYNLRISPTEWDSGTDPSVNAVKSEVCYGTVPDGRLQSIRSRISL